jgi:uncharacterized protein YbaR (Trm112 family)
MTMPTSGVSPVAAMTDSRVKKVFYRPSAAPTYTAMDRKLLDLLVCPTTRQPLALLDGRGLQAVNAAIAGGSVRRGDGEGQSEALREALVTRDRKTVYRIDDGIPVLLAEESIATAQIEGFPAA